MNTFIGRSNPDEEVCRHIPRSADPANIENKGTINHFQEKRWIKQIENK